MMRVINLLLLLAATLAAAFAQGDLLTRGLEAFHRGDYVAAERDLKGAAANGDDPRARTFLALTLAATGRCEPARAGLLNAFESGAPDMRKLSGLALVQCQIAADRLDEASPIAAKLKSQFPDDADVLYQSARLHMRAWNDTIYQLYQKAPASFRVNQISGEILETQGNFAEAAAEFRKAIEKNPKALNLHFRLGRALLMSSHDPQMMNPALKEFEAELALNPADCVAEYQAGQILMAQQKPDLASPRLEHALKLNPEFPEALIALGKLRLDQKKTEEAIELLQRAVKLTPRSESAHYSLMMAYRNAGRMDDARREKAEFDKLQKAPEGEFTDFLKKLGEKPVEK